MARNYYSGSGNAYGKGRSNSNRNGDYSSRKSDSGFYDSKPECETRMNNGYKQFRDPNTGEWVYTHRRVMEKKFGGDIFPCYEVHHKNHDKCDNRPENLVVMNKQEHQELHSIERNNRRYNRRERY